MVEYRWRQGGWKRDRGATALTYGLVVGLVAIAGIAAVTRIGEGVDVLFGTTASTLTGTIGTSEPQASPSPSPSPSPESYGSCGEAPSSSGVYSISVGGETRDVYCDQDFDGGGYAQIAVVRGSNNVRWTSMIATSGELTDRKVAGHFHRIDVEQL